MIKHILLFLWQLPQNMAGGLIALFHRRDGCFRHNGKLVCIDDRFVSDRPQDATHNGVSLGMFIILEKYREDSISHEYGHCRQSELLGPLYLPVIGVCSGIHNLVQRCKEYNNKPRKDYYSFWTERWADRLGGVKR